MRHPKIALVLTNACLPGPMNGRNPVPWLKLNRPRIIVMIATGGFGRMNAVKDLRVACAFLKPHKLQMAGASILKVLEHRVTH